MDPRSDSYGTPKTGAEPSPMRTHGEGWWQILNRRDTLAAKVALLGQMWDGGRDWPAGALVGCVPRNAPLLQSGLAGCTQPLTSRRPFSSKGSLDRLTWKIERVGCCRIRRPGCQPTARTTARVNTSQPCTPRWLSTTAPLSSFTLMTAPSGSLPTRGTLACPAIRQCRTELGYSGSGP